MACSPVLATVVWVLHMAFVAFMVLAPFSDDDEFVTLHFLGTPFLWLHWALNDDTCALTLLEKNLRGIRADNKSFFHSLVSPVYKIRDEHVRVLAWGASVVLWFVSASKVARRPGMVKRALFGP